MTFACGGQKGGRSPAEGSSRSAGHARSAPPRAGLLVDHSPVLPPSRHGSSERLCRHQGKRRASWPPPPPCPRAREKLSPGLRRATAAAPPRSCAVETSCHRGRAPLRQTLAVAPRHPAALQRRSLDAPWHTPRAEIVRLRGVPINRDAGDEAAIATATG